ncbi:MAG: class I SAM-dependent methyltransferase [Clostridia bacterium]|nr:class I SAM-dependent methyltransferase [Clostridia bacterium]
MNNVNKTLYIPLYGKAMVSAKGLFIRDPDAERIWAAEGFALKGKSKSKWLAYYMGIRAAVFDAWMQQQMDRMPDAVVIHIGCGMDSRMHRVDAPDRTWYDVDFPEVIAERSRYYTETEHYKMIAGDASEEAWLNEIPERKQAIVVMEGVSMYLPAEKLQEMMRHLCGHFEQVALLMDCYTERAAKWSKYKNPINDVGVTQVYGMDDPTVPAVNGWQFVQEHDMTPMQYINELTGMEKWIFSKVFAGGFARKLYRLFEYTYTAG